MLLAIDIGNTDVTFGLIKESQVLSVQRIESSIHASQGLLLLDISKVTDIVISSVVPKQTIDYQKECMKLLDIEPFIVKYNNVEGLILDVENPSSVGADRICNIMAVNEKFNISKIIIDFGTATTYDIVDERGAFIGGAIAPGIDISANYLYTKAALLKNTAFKFPKFAVGKNTETNLQSGIMFGAIDSVEGMIKRILKETKWENQQFKIILTGGFSTILSPQFSFQHFIEPNLTLYGIYAISVKK